MSASMFRFLLIGLGAAFLVAFVIIVIPPLLDDPNVIGAFAAGFVNPYAAGYSLDVIFCWFILTVWVIYETKQKKIRHAWIAPILGVVPGVATGFAVYLLLRLRHEQRAHCSAKREGNECMR